MKIDEFLIRFFQSKKIKLDILAPHQLQQLGLNYSKNEMLL